MARSKTFGWRRKGDELSAFVLNRVHAEKKMTIGGLVAGKTYNASLWNGDKHGTLKSLDAVRADDAGNVTISVPEMAVETLTTR